MTTGPFAVSPESFTGLPADPGSSKSGALSPPWSANAGVASAIAIRMASSPVRRRRRCSGIASSSAQGMGVLRTTRQGCRRFPPLYRLSLPGQLRPGQLRPCREGRELLIAHVARRPAEAAVGVERHLLRRAVLEHLADAPGDVLRRVLVEALDVDDAGAETPAVAVFLPQLGLRHLTPGELQHELVGAGLEHAGEVRLVRTEEARAAEAVAEADVEAQPRFHPFGGEVEEARHLLAGDVAAGRLVELDPVGARRDQRLELVVDHLGEPLRDVDHALVGLAGVDSRAERERSRARGLHALRRVRPQILVVLHEAESRGRRLDAADGFVPLLHVVAPRPGLSLHRER